MDMPDNCLDCPFKDFDDVCVVIGEKESAKYETFSEMKENCPLVEVDNMKCTGLVRRIDDLGRICIPKEIRRTLFGNEDLCGEPFEFFTNPKNGELIIKKYYEKGECDD